ncbi:unnamed protein product [Orchesella dallaii]|uniref:Uncharacterized protein n=1 Tax=Orchesella dallaii TaxID=48710 RepID=A0ABP1RUX5_9HEXA
MIFANFKKLSGIVVLAFAFTQVSLCFDQNHMEVVYEPLEDKPFADYTNDGIMAQLSTISTKFRKVMIIVWDLNIANSSKFAIPHAAAMHNRRHKQVLRVSICLLITKFDDVSDLRGDLGDMIEKADAANRIYPGTVKKIYLETSKFLVMNDKEAIDTYEDTVADFRVETNLAYDLTASLSIIDCESARLPMILRQYSSVSFDWFPTPEYEPEFEARIAIHPIVAVEKLTKRYESCLETIKSFGVTPSVSIKTGWINFARTDDKDELREYYKNMKVYWDLLNTFAIKYNIIVTMWSAFDHPPQLYGKDLQHSGWWGVEEKYFCFAMISDWDPDSGQYIATSKYLLWNVQLFTIVGSFYPIILALYSYSTLHIGINGPDNEWVSNPSKMATNVMGWILSCLIGMIAIAAFRLLGHVANSMYLKNQLLKCTETVTNLMKGKHLPMTEDQKRTLQQVESLSCILFFGSILFPLCYAGLFCNEHEPVHNLFKDWLEVDVSIEFQYLPLIFLFFWAAMNGGSAVFDLVFLLILYLWTSLIIMMSMVPKAVASQVSILSGRISYKIHTNCFGLLDEDEVMAMYRTQQLFNVLVNEIFESLLVSGHQVGLMVLLVFSSFLLMVFPRLLLSAGIFAFGFVAGVLFVVVLMLYMECTKLGQLSEVSDQILEHNKNMTYRSSLFHKFLKSCPNIKVKIASPFYSITQSTMGDVFEEYLNFLVTLFVARP